MAVTLVFTHNTMQEPKLAIEFERTDAFFSPGENVIGTVKIKLDKAEECKALSIKIEGQCRVRWVKMKRKRNLNGSSEIDYQDFTALETYFERMFYLIRSTEDNDVTRLPAGESVYVFNIPLPQNIPCSFKHRLGSIRYLLTANLIIPYNNQSYNSNAEFNVITPFDLNLIPRASVGIDDEEYQNFSCFCVVNLGSLYARIKTPASGYVPGQTLEVTVSFYNDSKTVEVTTIKSSIEQILKFQATRPKSVIKCERTIIGKDKKRGSFGDKSEVNLFIKVPQVLPSNLVHCSLIEIQYRLNIKIITSGMHNNTEKSYPILIGTVPLFSTIPTTAVSLIHVQRGPTAPAMDAVVPVSEINTSSSQSNHLNTSQSVSNQSFAVVPTVRQGEYQPIGFVFSTNPYQNLLSVEREAPPPSYEECTNDISSPPA